jgi:hypothetical protein
MRKYFVLLLFYAQCGFSQTVIKEGILEKESYWLEDKGGGVFDTTKHKSYRIYFYDSCVVYESKSYYPEYPEQEITKWPTRLYKYTFFDLRTRLCHDYYSFTDTSTMQCNYKMPKGKSLLWNFWETQGDEDGNFVFVGDTIIAGKSIKLVENKNAASTQRKSKWIYYLTSNMPNIIFHINGGAIDRRYKGYKAFRLDLIQEWGRSCSSMRLIKEKLSFEERSVLKKWLKNSKEIQEPLMDYKDVFYQCGPQQSPLIPKDF